MKLREFTTEEKATRQRLDPKCWTGKKIGNPKTKVKGGVRVNNCVPAESVTEMDKSQTPPGRDGSNDEGSKKEYPAKIITPKKAVKDGEKILNKAFRDSQRVDPRTGKKMNTKGVAEGLGNFAKAIDNLHGWYQDDSSDPNIERYEFDDREGGYYAYGTIEHNLKTGEIAVDFEDKSGEYDGDIKATFNSIGDAMNALRRITTQHRYNTGKAQSFDRLGDRTLAGPDDVYKTDRAGKKGTLTKSRMDTMKMSSPYRKTGPKGVLPEQGVAEGKADYNFDVEDLKRLERIRDLPTLKAQALALISKPSAKPMKPEKVEWFKNALERMNSPIKVIKLMYDLLLSGEGNAVVGTRSSMNPNNYRQRFGEQAMPDNFNGEYDDEAGMADNNLETLDRAVEGIDQLIDSGDNLPEWCQEKIAVAKSMLVAVWDYMYSEESSDEVDPEVDEMFEAMDELAEEMAIKNRVSKDLVWEQFEAMDDRVLYETAAWRRKEGKSKKGGLNAKGVASYRRENPGSKLQMAVTTKPSKLKPGSKAAKRRKSFCARMGGVKGPMKKPNGKPTRKALALRKWNC
jgi:hypothetical protein